MRQPPLLGHQKSIKEVLNLSQPVNTWAVHRPPDPSTQTPIPKWVYPPRMLERCPALAAKESNNDETDPPLPTFSPAADQGGMNRPMLECERTPLSAIRFAQALASASKEPSRLSPASPWDERRLFIAEAKSDSKPVLNPPFTSG